jgi:two-component system response regulator YesN
MLKLLIVDDEPIIRRGIHEIIDWAKYGYEICGEAEDGPSAVKTIIDLKPDLVLLDLHLPGFFGIEVIKKVKELESNKRKTNFLILSGYSEFEYVKEAINLEADGYITKPIDENILIERITSIALKIKRKDPEEIKRIQYLEIMEGTYKKEMYESFCFGLGPVQAAFVSVDELQSGETVQAASVHKVKNFFQSNVCSIFSYNDFIVIFFENTVETAVKNLLENLYDYLEKNKCSSAITLGSRFEEEGTGEGILKTSKEAEKLMESVFFFKNKKIICPDDVNSMGKTASTPDIEEKIKKLCSYIQVIDLEKIRLFFQEMEKVYINSGKNHQEIRQECMAFMIEVRSGILKKIPALKERPEIGDGKETLDAIMKKRYLKEITSAMTEACLQISECLPLLSADASLQRVISYVKNNYNEDLKLETLSELFNYNCAYLGKRFKEHTGKSFHTYLDMLRIDAAKEFLQSTDMKVYEISSAVGYTNTDYFYSKFKKYAGESPLVFRKNKP